MRDSRGRLRHMLDAIAKIERYAARGREAFEQEELIQTWVLYHIQLIGEAAAQLGKRFQDAHPEIPWAQLVVMRNVLVHEYFGVDLQEVWRTVERDLPVLKQQIEALVKRLEDQAMAGKWRELPFSEAVLINPPVRLERGKRYPFVDMDALNPGARSAFATEEREFSGGGSRFEHGDTLMARITPCLENGKIARFCARQGSGVGHGSTEFIVIRERPGVTHSDYAYYLTLWEGVRGYAISHMTGTSGRQRVPINCLQHLTVPIPPLPEQRAIAHILGTLDDKIKLNRRMSETLEAMARALFKAWFVDFEPVRAKMEGRWQRGQSLPGLPAHLYDLFPDRLVDSEPGEIPEGWGVGTLGKLSDKPQYGYTASATEEPVGPKFLRITDINKLAWIEWSTVPFCKIKQEDFEQYRLHPGDVLIARMADPGHGVVIEEPVEAVFLPYTLPAQGSGLYSLHSVLAPIRRILETGCIEARWNDTCQFECPGS